MKDLTCGPTNRMIATILCVYDGPFPYVRDLVRDTETVCDALENLTSRITDRISIERFAMEPLQLSVPSTVANIRMFYYIVNKNYPKDSTIRGFEQLRWLLTEPESGWESLTDVEKVALLRHSREIYSEVFVFV